MSDELRIVVEAVQTDRAEGSATRFGFDLAWTASRDGGGWLIEVPRGHSLGPDGRGAFEVVTGDDWRGFAAAVEREIRRGE